jgi:hypothetical protein
MEGEPSSAPPGDQVDRYLEVARRPPEGDVKAALRRAMMFHVVAAEAWSAKPPEERARLCVCSPFSKGGELCTE